MMRAAQAAHERGVRVLAAPPVGIEVRGREVAEDLRARRAGRAVPWTLDEAERGEILGDGAEVENVGVAVTSGETIDGPLASEAIPEIDVPVSDVARAARVLRIDRHPCRHRVLLARVEVVEPCRDHACATEIAAIFVVDDVRWIIGALAFVGEWTERAPGQPARSRRAIEVAAPPGPGQNPLERCLVERASGPDVGFDRELGRQTKSRSLEVDDGIAGGPPAGGVVEARGDRRRRGRALDLIVVRLEHELRPSDRDAEARVGAVVLAAVDQPASVGGVRRELRAFGAIAACSLLRRHRMRTDAVDEPARVGDLVEGVHVLRLRGGVGLEELR